MSHHFSSIAKVFSPGPLLDRHMETLTLNSLWKDRHSYIYASHVRYSAIDPTTLLVSGFVRGAKLNGDRTIHIPSSGDFVMGRIFEGADETGHILHEGTDKDGIQELESDDMDGEQTWPTDQEVRVGLHPFLLIADFECK